MERKKEGEKEGKEERKRIDWHGSYSPTSCYMTINIESFIPSEINHDWIPWCSYERRGGLYGGIYY